MGPFGGMKQSGIGREMLVYVEMKYFYSKYFKNIPISVKIDMIMCVCIHDILF